MTINDDQNDEEELLKQASNLDLDKEDIFENVSAIIPVKTV